MADPHRSIAVNVQVNPTSMLAARRILQTTRAAPKLRWISYTIAGVEWLAAIPLPAGSW
jgi:hypothetical protein